MKNMSNKRVVNLIYNLVSSKGSVDQLKDIHYKIIEQLLDNKKHQEIAQATGYTYDYVRKRASELFEILSNLLGQKVTKKNFCYTLNNLLIPCESNKDLNIELNFKLALKKKIQRICSITRYIGAPGPLELENIYVNIDVLRAVTEYGHFRASQNRFEAESLEDIDFNDEKERISGLEAARRFDRLFVFGSPGSGKTTYLKYLALKFIHDHSNIKIVPIFIRIKDFVDTPSKLSLLDFIVDDLGVSKELIINLFECGEALLLLDGLDEISGQDAEQVLREIRKISRRHPENRFVITCRIAARQETLDEFTYVRIASLDDNQISEISSNILKSQSNQFIQCVGTRPKIKELASVPLLLSLLCSIFEDQAHLPSKRSVIYFAGVQLLLKRWSSNQIKRAGSFHLSTKDIQVLLGKIAKFTFERDIYFFPESTVSLPIKNYLNSRLGYSDLEKKSLTFESLLNLLAVQYGVLSEQGVGVYSFPHLTFQEYFAAVEICSEENRASELKLLASRVAEPKWREVLLLTVEMLNQEDADFLLTSMKSSIDHMVALDPEIQRFLIHVEKVSTQMLELLPAQLKYKLVALKAHNFDRNAEYDLGFCKFVEEDLAVALELRIDPCHECHSSRQDRFAQLSPHLASNSKILKLHGFIQDFYRDLTLGRFPPGMNQCSLTPEVEKKLLQLRNKIPNPFKDQLVYEDWLCKHGDQWLKEIEIFFDTQRQHDMSRWGLTAEKLKLMKQYYDANKLLVDCLKSDCQASEIVKQQIEDTLLSPLSKLSRCD